MRYSHLATFGKISLLTCCILGVFQAYSYMSEGDFFLSESVSEQNRDVFSSAKTQNLGTVSIAITTAVGNKTIKSSGLEQASALFYAAVDHVGVSDSERSALRKEMIETNMSIIGEYLALVKTDIIASLASSPQRKSGLESLITQLELRYKNAAMSVKNLSDYQEKLSANIQQLQERIDALKEKMNIDFGIFDSAATLKDIEMYLELKKEYQSNYVDIMYINMFLKQYSFLSGYNKKLIDTLINNKEALINQSFVVIPDSGDEFLKTFKLLYEEADYKAEQEALQKEAENTVQ